MKIIKTKFKDLLIYKKETFYQGIAKQKQYNGSSYENAIDLNGASSSWRSNITSSSNSWQGSLSGFWITNLTDNLNSHPQFLSSPLSVSFICTATANKQGK